MNDLPEWYDDNKIDEILFCQEFLMEHPMVCVRGTFFTIERRITDERELKKLIYEKLKVYVKNGVAKKVDGLLEVLRTEAYLFLMRHPGRGIHPHPRHKTFTRMLTPAQKKKFPPSWQSFFPELSVVPIL